MSRVGGFSESDAIRIGHAVRVIEKGGIEHPFHRRQVPVIAGSELVVLRNADTTFLGRITDTGITTTIDATYGSDTISDVDGAYINTVIPPGCFFWALQLSTGWHAVSGGVTYIEGTINSDLDLVYPGFDNSGSYEQDIPVGVTQLCDEVELVEGMKAGAIYLGGGDYTGQPGSFGFRVIHTCCPPDPD